MEIRFINEHNNPYGIWSFYVLPTIIYFSEGHSWSISWLWFTIELTLDKR
jgi:hypothetical protein